MRTPFIFVGLLSVSAAVAQNRAVSPNVGTIYGTVTAQDGLPAKGLILNAWPLGGMLAMALPWTKTNDKGGFRFEHLPLGKYTVYAQDKEEGYSSFSTGTGGSHPPEVELTTEHSEAEFNLRLPPEAGFLLFHLTNQRTGAAISGVEVTVMLAKSPTKIVFSGGGSSTQAILVPSDENLLLHVMSWGFREWDKSRGDGKPIRLAPGNRLTLDVQLEPANSLRDRIPDPNPEEYQGIRDAKDWRNPYLIVRADGIEIVGMASNGSPIAIESVAAALERLPESAWPYGLVVAIQDNGIVAGESDRARIDANRELLVGLLNDLGVVVGFWPPASD